jgi:hypothetical protein
MRIHHGREQGWVGEDEHLDAQRFGGAMNCVEYGLRGVVR